jgi:UDP-N-acetylglucosamine acyltransferase
MHPNVWIGPESTVHPSANIVGPVQIGRRVSIGPNVTIIGPVSIGDDTSISSGAVIGERAEHRGAEELTAPREPDLTITEHDLIRIGARVRVREHVVIQRGLPAWMIGRAERVRGTVVNDDAYLMHGVHVAHDCLVGRSVTLSPFVVLGGHTSVHWGATMGIHSATHQFSTVGAFAMVGMGAMVTRDVPPFTKAVGVPARAIGPNTVGRSRFVALGHRPLTEQVLQLEFKQSSMREALPLPPETNHDPVP